MANDERTLRGVVHGNIVALFDDPGLPDGEVVSVIMKPCEMTPEEQRDSGLVKSFGAWADDPQGVDEFVKWTYEQRKLGRPDLEP